MREPADLSLEEIAEMQRMIKDQKEMVRIKREPPEEPSLGPRKRAKPSNKFSTLELLEDESFREVNMEKNGPRESEVLTVD
jgi:hypothetical protein